MTITATLNLIINNAYMEARKRQHEFITPEHLLFSSLKVEKVKNLLSDAGANDEQILALVEPYLNTKIPTIKDGDPTESVVLEQIIQDALFMSASAGKQDLDICHVLVTMLDEPKTHASYCLRKAGVDRLQLLKMISAYNMLHAVVQENSGSKTRAETKGDDTEVKQSFLERFTRNLTAEAQQGLLDTLIGRTDELERTMQILCRRRKNNPLHVGSPGVGKTALTEGLAQKIAGGDVPHFLKGCEIISLNIASLLAGAKLRGDFEERISTLIAELNKKKKIILYIDEIHLIVGAGGNGATNSLDAANLLQPLFDSKKVRCIGSTTFEDYARTIEKQSALARRFQKIDILEPTEQETISILKGLAPKYEKFHLVEYTTQAITSAVELSRQFISNRYLPDKAIDVIDEAGAYIQLHPNENYKKNKEHMPLVEQDLIEKIIAKMARIPQISIQTSEKQSLKELDTQLLSSIFGQDEAVSLVVQAVKRSRSGLRSEGKTIANFLFAGPTGVGKTELAKKLAQILNIPLLRFDMSEYQEKHTVSRL
ncbi:MAG: AAA family ATPase, partial [Treponemataceae bacterium]